MCRNKGGKKKNHESVVFLENYIKFGPILILHFARPNTRIGIKI